MKKNLTILTMGLICVLLPDISLSFTPKHKTCLETLVVEYGYWDIQCDEYYANCLTALRAYRKRKPLPQDRQNCHRKLLKQGYSHKKIALGRWNCNKILNKKKANKKSSGSASHEQCLRRLFCEYGSINSSAKKSYEACQRSIKVKRGGNLLQSKAFQNCCYNLLNKGYSRHSFSPVFEKCDSTLTGKSDKTSSKNKKTAPRKLTEKEKKARHAKWLSSFQPTAEEERERIRKRDEKWLAKEKAEKAQKKRETKQWARRSTAKAEKNLGERGNVQTCLSQFRNASLHPPSTFSSEEACLKALDLAIKNKKSGKDKFNERIEKCINELNKIGYPVSTKVKNSYIVCEGELEDARALAAEMNLTETQVNEEKEALKKCLAAFKEEKISLSTSDLTTLDGCERRLAKGRERNEKTRKYKANKAETDRLLNLIEKEREILKRIEFAGQIPLEPFRSDELSRWTGEWNSILSCLDEFKKLGITIPPNSQNRFTDCKKNLWKEQEKIFKAEQIEIDKQQKERWDKQFQEKIAENKRKRLEAEEKQTTEINEDKSKKEKEETSSLSGKVFPANLPGIDFKKFDLLNEGNFWERVTLLENVRATLKKGEHYYEITLAWKYIDPKAVHNLRTTLGSVQRIFMQVYSSYDRGGHLYKTKLKKAWAPFISYNDNVKLSLGTSISDDILPRKTNHIWLEVWVIIGKTKKSEWIYAGKIVK